MLKFVFGRSGSGKSYHIRQQIRKVLKESDSKVVLLVPEQFSFETERRIYRDFRGAEARRIEVASFMRLSNSIFREYGGLAGTYADLSDKTIVMSMALEQIKDTLTVYSKSSNKALTKCMLELIDEFKTWGVSPEKLEQVCSQLDDGPLKDKMKELSLIYISYEGIFSRLYLDPLDDIARAGKLLEHYDYFQGKVVFVDEFDGFTANENALLSAMIKQAREVTVALCLPASSDMGSDGLFEPVKKTYRKLIKLAKQLGTSIEQPQVIAPGQRFASREIAYLEQHILSESVKPYQGHCEAVRVFGASNEFEEVEFLLATVKKLVQEDQYRYSDIVITARDIGTYQEALLSGFAHYDIPYFMDMLSPVNEKAVVRFVEGLLKTAANKCQVNDVIGMLKCGVLDYSAEDISRFENYIYTWDIKGSAFLQEFTAHPRGYVEKMQDSDIEELAFVNQIRSEVVSMALKLRERSENATGLEITATVYELLEQLHVKDNVQQGAENLLRFDQEFLAKECVQVWDALMEILDSLAISLKDSHLSLKRYLELYQLVAENYQVGSIPQHLDAVAVGSSDRIRTANPRAVFVLGMNDGVFPYVPSTDGLLTDSEKKLLEEWDLELSRNAEEMILQERFLAYKALTCCSERLYLSYRRSDVGGRQLSCSFLIDQVKTLFGTDCLVDGDCIDPLYFCRTRQTAFSRFARCFDTDSPLRSTLEQYLRESGYTEKIDKLYQMHFKKGYRLKNKETAVRLFGKNMLLSASRFEDYHKCRFLYFCKSGLGAKPRVRAELNPLETGTLIHDVLYALMSDPVHPLAEMNAGELKRAIKVQLDAYIVNKMSGDTYKTRRFLYLYNRLKMTLFQILSCLQKEMEQSDFIPTDFELQIGRGKPVDAFETISPDGSRVWVEGRIDRVDTYVKNGVKYFRVIDYKTGTKEFKLSDLYYGINMQMLIYLFSIWNTKNGKYKNSLPAGILYLPAKRIEPELSREKTEEAVNLQAVKAYKMNGLVLDDEEIVRAMEQQVGGIFIPAKLLAKEKVIEENGEKKVQKFDLRYSSLISLAQLGELERYTEKLLGDMAEELHRGEIAALPLAEGDTVPCTYCDYRVVCGREQDDPVCEKRGFSKPEDIFKEIEEVLANG